MQQQPHVVSSSFDIREHKNITKQEQTCGLVVFETRKKFTNIILLLTLVFVVICTEWSKK